MRPRLATLQPPKGARWARVASRPPRLPGSANGSACCHHSVSRRPPPLRCVRLSVKRLSKTRRHEGRSECDTTGLADPSSGTRLRPAPRKSVRSRGCGAGRRVSGPTRRIDQKPGRALRPTGPISPDDPGPGLLRLTVPSAITACPAPNHPLCSRALLAANRGGKGPGREASRATQGPPDSSPSVLAVDIWLLARELLLTEEGLVLLVCVPTSHSLLFRASMSYHEINIRNPGHLCLGSDWLLRPGRPTLLWRDATATGMPTRARFMCHLATSPACCGLATALPAAEASSCYSQCWGWNGRPHPLHMGRGRHLTSMSFSVHRGSLLTLNASTRGRWTPQDQSARDRRIGWVLMSVPGARSFRTGGMSPDSGRGMAAVAVGIAFRQALQTPMPDGSIDG